MRGKSSNFTAKNTNKQKWDINVSVIVSINQDDQPWIAIYQANADVIC